MVPRQGEAIEAVWRIYPVGGTFVYFVCSVRHKEDSRARRRRELSRGTGAPKLARLTACNWRVRCETWSWYS